MVLARQAVTSSRLNGNERKNLREAVDFIGTPNDGNKVVISFDDDGLKEGAQGYDRNEGITKISLRPDSDIRNLGKNALHECKHGLIDSSRGRMDESRHERLDNERGAYRTQAYFQKSIQYSSSSIDPWTPVAGVSELNIERKARQSVDAACAGSVLGSCK